MSASVPHLAMFAWGPLVIIGGIILVLLLVVLMLIVLIRALNGGGRKQALNEEEKGMLRQIWEGQDRMEQRITHLETILLERGK